MFDGVKGQHGIGHRFAAAVPEQENVLVVIVEFVNAFFEQRAALLDPFNDFVFFGFG